VKALILLLLLPLLAHAASPTVILTPTVTLVWTPPIANTDGSTPANVQGYNVYRSTTLPVPTGAPAVPISKAVPLLAGTLTYIDTPVPAGTYYYAVTAWGCNVPNTGNCIEGPPLTSGAIMVVSTPPQPATPSTPGKPGSITVTVNGVQAPP
jgi:hypothetical protein